MSSSLKTKQQFIELRADNESLAKYCHETQGQQDYPDCVVKGTRISTHIMWVAGDDSVYRYKSKSTIQYAGGFEQNIIWSTSTWSD